MKNIIVGTGKFAHEVAKRMYKFGISIDRFVNNYDPNKHLPSNVYGNKKVEYIEELEINNLDEYNFIIAKKPMFIGQSIDCLRKNGYKNIYVVNEEMFFSRQDSPEELLKYFDKINFDKPFLNYLETNIVDNCNLNCKGCAHFSNVCDRSMVSLESFNNDLKLLCEKFNIYNFRLLGGEPLLHPQIKEIIEIARYYLPNSRIVLVTNGLMIPSLPSTVLQSISDCNIIVSISLYKPTSLLLTDIEYTLKEYNINYLINDDYFREHEIIEKFHTRLSTEKKISEDNANKMCSGRFCRFLRDGKISKCYYPLLVHILNNKYGSNFIISDDDYINIYEIIDGWEAIDNMNGNISFCDYCREQIEDFEWMNGHIKDAKLEDFVLKKSKK